MRYDYTRFDASYRPGGFARVGATALLPVDGPISFGRSVPDPWGYGPSTLGSADLVSAIRAAVADPSVKTIALDVHSPGGSAFAFTDLRDAVEAARKSGRRVVAIVNGVAASLAYGLIAGADLIVATPQSIVGSIGGVMPTVMDCTKALEKEGIVPFTPKAGDLKDVGNPASPLTDAARAMLQGNVEAAAEPLFEHVAAGRRLPVAAVKAMQAAIYVGPQALAAGLVDRLMPFEAALELVGIVTPQPTPAGTPGVRPPGSPSMDIKTVEDLKKAHPDLVAAIRGESAEKPATFPELKARFGDDPAFVCECQEQGLTLTAAVELRSKRLAEKVNDLAGQLAAAKAQPAAPAKPPVPGAAPVPPSTPSPSAPVDMASAVQLCMGEAGNDWRKAQHLAMKRFPRLADEWFKKGCPGMDLQDA